MTPLLWECPVHGLNPVDTVIARDGLTVRRCHVCGKREPFSAQRKRARRVPVDLR